MTYVSCYYHAFQGAQQVEFFVSWIVFNPPPPQIFADFEKITSVLLCYGWDTFRSFFSIKKTSINYCRFKNSKCVFSFFFVLTCNLLPLILFMLEMLSFIHNNNSNNLDFKLRSLFFLKSYANSLYRVVFRHIFCFSWAFFLLVVIFFECVPDCLDLKKNSSPSLTPQQIKVWVYNGFSWWHTKSCSHFTAELY